MFKFITRNKEISAGLLAMMVMCCVFVVTPTPVRSAKFVLAEWDYPDEYGQGIESVYIAHNKSGSFVDFPESPYSAGDDTFIELFSGGGYHLRLIVYVQLNRTHISLSKPWNDGHLFIRLSVTVTNALEIEFFKQNLTYDAFGGTADPVEWYKYSVILDFIPIDGSIYKTVVSYEIYY